MEVRFMNSHRTNEKENDMWLKKSLNFVEKDK